MGWNIDGIETEIEDKEEALLELEQESQDIEQRDIKLKQAIQRLSDDAAVSSLIEKNSEANEQKKEQIEEEKKRVSSEINTLQTQLQEELDGINEERNVLETLDLIGEDVSEAQEILADREQILQELNWRLQDLAERLGIKLDELEVGNMNDDYESPLDMSKKEKSSEFRQNFAENSFTTSEMIVKADKSELQSIVRNEQLAKKVDFGDLDIDVARELVDTIRNAKSKYPFLDFPFIGATQSLNADLRKNIGASLTRLYVQNNPEASREDIAKRVKLQTEAYMSQFKIEDDDLAVSISVKTPQRIARPKPRMETAGYVTEYVGDTFSSKLSGISINAEKAKDYSALCKDLEITEACGASPKGCKSVNYLINHEIAHQLDHLLNLSSDPDIMREYKKHIGLTKEEQIANVCTYASTNIHEFVAEAWAESQCSSSPRAVANLVEEKVSFASAAYMKSKKGDEEYVREREI